jgi:hypothetical protein
MKQRGAVNEEDGYESVDEGKEKKDSGDSGDSGDNRDSGEGEGEGEAEAEEEGDNDEDKDTDQDTDKNTDKSKGKGKEIVEYAAPPESVTDEVEHTLGDWNSSPESELRPGASIDMNEEEIMQGWSIQSQKKIGEPDNSQFKNLFVSPSTVSVQSGSPLESMSLKDLRQVASSRKISGAKSMKRNDLLEALRASSSLFPVRSLDE